MELRFKLIRHSDRQCALDAVRLAPAGWMVTVKDPTRSEEQSALFHKICGLMAKHADHGGRRFDKDGWKHLLISGHAVHTRAPFQPVVGLEGEFLNIRESSARMTVSRASSLIEYALFIAQEKGIILHD